MSLTHLQLVFINFSRIIQFWCAELYFWGQSVVSGDFLSLTHTLLFLVFASFTAGAPNVTVKSDDVANSQQEEEKNFFPFIFAQFRVFFSYYFSGSLVARVRRAGNCLDFLLVHFLFSPLLSEVVFTGKDFSLLFFFTTHTHSWEDLQHFEFFACWRHKIFAQIEI